MVNNLMTGSFPPEVTLLASDGPRATGAGNLNYLELFNNVYLFNNFDSSWVSELGSNLSMFAAKEFIFSLQVPTLTYPLVSSRIPLFWYHRFCR